MAISVPKGVVLDGRGIVVPILPNEDADIRTEAALRDARAHARGGVGVIPGYGNIVPSPQAHYHGATGEYAIHKALGIPMRWTTWEEDADEQRGLDVASLIQSKFTLHRGGDFCIPWRQGELRAPYGILVTPCLVASWPQPGMYVVLRGWVNQARWMERRVVKDYGYGAPVRAVRQADMFDMATFRLGGG